MAAGAARVEQARRHRPDVALMDIRMPRLDGLAATQRLAALPHPPQVVVLTMFDLDEYVYRALRLGAVGFLLKANPAEELVAAVRSAAAGDAVLAPRVTRRLLDAFADRGATRTRARSRLEPLTGRERDVLACVAAAPAIHRRRPASGWVLCSCPRPPPIFGCSHNAG